jgi:hypothetical protein
VEGKAATEARPAEKRQDFSIVQSSGPLFLEGYARELILRVSLNLSEPRLISESWHLICATATPLTPPSALEHRLRETRTHSHTTGRPSASDVPQEAGFAGGWAPCTLHRYLCRYLYRFRQIYIRDLY